jgi:hypothetical protein
MLESINHKLCLRDNANMPSIFFVFFKEKNKQ